MKDRHLGVLKESRDWLLPLSEFLFPFLRACVVRVLFLLIDDVAENGCWFFFFLTANWTINCESPFFYGFRCMVERVFGTLVY